MYVYINYPNPHIEIHHDADCKKIHLHKKEGQRHIVVRLATLEDVRKDFLNQKYEFKSEKHFNDLWLDISPNAPEQELGLVHEIQRIIGQRYKPLADAPIEPHC